ncbi:MAG: UvrD-helicase domain-containing protein [Phycisphaerae bacterium]|nr:UvrD-helicase domain-containing protein [Phycisphaerae bacterium]
MSERPLTDAQRAAARDRLGENLALRSGAGCGKTFVLARRFTELLLGRPDADDPLKRFMALTFTDKAALEMRDRVRRFLTDRAHRAAGADRRRLLAWLDELPAARISTIHSFCAGVLRARAVEAGLDPAFTVCSDTLLTSRLSAEAADEAVLSAIEAGDDDVLTLLTALSYKRVADNVDWLVTHRTDWRYGDYARPAATLTRWKELLAAERRRAFEVLTTDDRLRRNVDELEAVACNDPHDKLAVKRDAAIAAIRRLQGGLDAWTPETFEPIEAAAKPRNVGSKKAWGCDTKDVRAALKAVAEPVAALAHLAEALGDADTAAAEALATLTRLAIDAEARYAAEKRRRGIVDFTDLLAHTARLVADDAGVRRALSASIDQLLIDECQDTSAVQRDLLWGLLAPDAETVPADGRLFVVGDAKQSIYRFRGAQVEVFEELCERLGERHRETLDLSFRAHPACVAFVNELFAPLMGEAYAPLTAHRVEVPAEPAVDIVLATASEDYPLDDAATAGICQAAATAQRIAEMIAAGERRVWNAHTRDWRAVRPGDVAILLARMKHSGAYERELAARGVPYYVVGGTEFFRQQEVYDVLNALRAADNPYDDVAFLGALRSALFGLDDASLMRLADALDPPYLPALLAGDAPRPRIGDLSDPDARTLSFAVELLGRLARGKDALGPAAMIDLLLAETGYEGAVRAQFNGRRKLGNVRRLADLARTAAAEGTSLSRFLAAMNEQTLDQSRYEEAAVAGEGDDVVRLMTIHKAKGLEFPVVFVPDLNVAHKSPRNAILHRLDTGLTVKITGGDDDADMNGDAKRAAERDTALPLSYRIACDREDAAARAEDVRKLYVAATRAQDHLAFVAADRRTDDGSFHGGPGSPIGRLDAVLGIADAADAGRSIRYGHGQYTAAVRTLAPSAPPAPRRSATRGARWCVEAGGPDALAERMAEASADPPPLLGPIPPSVGHVDVAATALGDFEHCPMLYRWCYELRAPVAREADATGAPHGAAAQLDAATLGTVYHTCMELLDFENPQPAAALMRRALADENLTEIADTDALTAELDGMLTVLRDAPLWTELRGASEALRELDFALAAGPATVIGQIDLLYRDAGGDWHIVDYKSDRLDGANVAEHARRYETQMLAYATAAGRFLADGAAGEAPPVADATLYFLRTGQTHVIDLSGESLAAAEQRITTIAGQLVAARRAGRFARCDSAACGACRYRRLCGRDGAA